MHDAPLQNYGEFDWYTVPESLPSGITLVVCDGPPSATLGGRYGLLPTLGAHFAPNCQVLMDDAIRSSEIDIISRWERESGAISEYHETRKGYACVTVTTPV